MEGKEIYFRVNAITKINFSLASEWLLNEVEEKKFENAQNACNDLFNLNNT